MQRTFCQLLAASVPLSPLGRSITSLVFLFLMENTAREGKWQGRRCLERVPVIVVELNFPGVVMRGLDAVFSH